jgi:hypothetical protein
MFRSVHRSSSGVVNVPRVITTCKIFCCAYPVVWLYVSVYVYLLRTGPCGPVRSRYMYTETYSHTTGYAQQNILQVVITRGTLTTPDDDR